MRAASLACFVQTGDSRVPLNNADMSLRDLKRAATRRASQWMARSFTRSTTQ